MGDQRHIPDQLRAVDSLLDERVDRGARRRVPRAEGEVVPPLARRGLGEVLVRAVGSAIQARGEVAFLHVLAENTHAIALYERLGFRTRRVRPLTPIVRRRLEESK